MRDGSGEQGVRNGSLLVAPRPAARVPRLLPAPCSRADEHGLAAAPQVNPPLAQFFLNGSLSGKPFKQVPLGRIGRLAAGTRIHDGSSARRLKR